jgi:hypothetical protein
MKDLKKHELTKLHKTYHARIHSSHSLTSYGFRNKAGPKREEAVVQAEVKFGYFLSKHHLALMLADHCSKLFLSLFPDSTIA